ncbi:serine/threonine-protein kinase [Pseudonocardia nigra]|uniref:serine/threonine-protein kinase n=1 Tax=Pseudonocardia nigra TaxID=1921578 RepID=UPI001C5EA9D9|nr:serine/threonine-protein kinase [Pseudonocardia nigra]
MSAPEDSPIRVGDRYRLDERIGAGAMGAVWRATDELLNRTVAVKELLAAAVTPTAGAEAALEESRQRILREGRIGARLQHPHVISMFDVVVHDDRPWLVMEYLPSRSLAAILGEKGSLEPREVAEIGRQVADGLAAAHVAGVVHRDVKPGNVLIAEDGRVKLTDFGVSRAVDDVQLTRTGLIAGTPAFLSPEVARGQDPTAASDVFALGATLYAAVEGTPPFGLDDNAYALLHKVATGVIRPPEQAGPLTGVIMKLLSIEPDDRPSAAQARDALAAVASGRESGLAAPATTAVMGGSVAAAAGSGPATVADIPRPAPAPARDAADDRRRRAPLLIAAVLAVLLIGGAITALALANSGGGDPGENQALPPAATSTSPPAPTSSEATTAPPTSTQTPTTTQPAPTSAAPSPTPAPTSAPPPPPPPATDPVAFVQNYYGLLPGNTDAAFALLSPSAQAASGGRSGFENFYGGMESVSLQNVRQTGENTVEATVVFDRREGDTTNEPYEFVVGTGSDGEPILQSFSRL